MRYAIVGAANFATTFSVVWLLGAKAGVPVWAASAVGYAAGTAQGFILNRSWTFAASASNRVGAEAAGFVAVNIIGALVFSGSNVVLHHWFGLAVSTILANCVVPPLTFVLNRTFVFRQR